MSTSLATAADALDAPAESRRERYTRLGRHVAGESKRVFGRGHRRAVRMVIPKYEREMRVAGLGAGVYVGSSHGAVGAGIGGFLGYQVPVVAYGAALWKMDHPILGALMIAAPFLAGLGDD